MKFTVDDPLQAHAEQLGMYVEAMAPMFPGRMAEQWVADAATHEQDIRGALASPGGRDSDGAEVATRFMTAGFIHSVESRGLPTLLVRTDVREWQTGAGDPVEVLSAETFELMRAVTGRRSEAQIRLMNWSGGASVYLPAFTFGPFRPAVTDIVE